MNRGVDAGMLRLARMGRVSAISCLAQGPSFRIDAPGLADANVDVGLHLNLTEAFLPASPERVMPLPLLIAQAYAGSLDHRWLDAHIARQLDSFEHVFGRPPDYADGHQHVHQLPHVLPALLRALRARYGMRQPWIRYTAPGMQEGVPWGASAKARLIGVLGSGAVLRAAGQGPWRTNRRLLGVYGLHGGQRQYAALLQAWLCNARDGDLVLCHPALPGPGSAAQRAAEFEVLACPELEEWMGLNGVAIVRPFWQ
ncbi:ChbG/HpnK family deacetylase [Bordetella petrii]|uniref:ChbG/HpnK family deacetylase n=1 Tax=Bordetella petrii TaxID=94624 RepID=UPI001E430933|nr:ChbG/HpnK family deacetylase [Bordetella petrii]MCD0502193.1 ChbG/HpnK family deacetylase [Bordetella petrii]